MGARARLRFPPPGYKQNHPMLLIGFSCLLCRGWESNPHAIKTSDLKSNAYTISPPRRFKKTLGGNRSGIFLVPSHQKFHDPGSASMAAVIDMPVPFDSRTECVQHIPPGPLRRHTAWPAWSPGRESNPRMSVLQTEALPLRHQDIGEQRLLYHAGLLL